MELLGLALGALSDAWVLILQPTTLGYLAFGVVMGISIGIFPGLGVLPDYR